MQRFTLATVSPTKLESLRIDGNILGEKQVSLKNKLKSLSVSLFLPLPRSISLSLYRAAALVTAMICNLPFPITPPGSLCKDIIPWKFSSSMRRQKKRRERKRFFMYRGLCSAEFSDAAAKWWLRFMLLTYDDSSFPCHLSQCSLISATSRETPIPIANCIRGFSDAQKWANCACVPFPSFSIPLSLPPPSITLSPFFSLKRIKIKLPVGNTTFNALLFADQISFLMINSGLHLSSFYSLLFVQLGPRGFQDTKDN